MKVRFDTGRKLAMSLRSRPDLETWSHYCVLLLRWEPALHQRRVDQRLQERQQQVDGLAHQERRRCSSMHDLTGDRIMMRHTSVCVQGQNDVSDDDTVLDIGGGGSPAVADHTSRTFLSKNSAKVLELDRSG